MALNEFSQIYKLVDPRNNEIRYVGQTRHSLSFRLSEHIGETRENFLIYPIQELMDRYRELCVKYPNPKRPHFAAWIENKRNDTRFASPKILWIKDVLLAGCEPTIHKLEGRVPPNKALEREKYWIFVYICQGIRLLNKPANNLFRYRELKIEYPSQSHKWYAEQLGITTGTCKTYDKMLHEFFGE
jgi:hypothetical protein